MSFFKEFKEFIKSILSWIYFLIAFSFFFFLFGLKEIEVLGRNLFLPLPTLHSFSAQFLGKIQADLLPGGVQLIATNPLSAFLAQTIVSLLLAFVLTFPFFLYKILGYLSPAFYKKEKKIILRILIPSIILFFSGCLFAYFLLIPSTFRILYSYTAVIGAIPFFAVQEFITLVFGIMIVVGIMFLLPIFMTLSSSLGLIEPDFWKKNWRYAFLTFLIFSAIITPDGTGITMIMLSLPLAGLYFLGTFMAMKRPNQAANNK